MAIKPFKKTEIISLIIIFVVLFAVSLPNFIVSMRRARDQIRRDDLGNIQKSLDSYNSDFEQYPLSTSDGHFLACKKPGTRVVIDKEGRLQADLIACSWGRDPIPDLTPGSTKVYANPLPGDPQKDKGISYVYFSDGRRYQIYAYFEGKDEPEYNSKIEAMGIMCGSVVCNVGRAYNVPIGISIEEYDKSLQENQK